MYSPVKIEAVTENPAHIIFVGLLNLERFKPREATYAMSFIPISFPILKRRRPEKKKIHLPGEVGPYMYFLLVRKVFGVFYYLSSPLAF